MFPSVLPRHPCGCRSCPLPRGAGPVSLRLFLFQTAHLGRDGVWGLRQLWGPYLLTCCVLATSRALPHPGLAMSPERVGTASDSPLCSIKQQTAGAELKLREALGRTNSLPNP